MNEIIIEVEDMKKNLADNHIIYHPDDYKELRINIIKHTNNKEHLLT